LRRVGAASSILCAIFLCQPVGLISEKQPMEAVWVVEGDLRYREIGPATLHCGGQVEILRGRCLVSPTSTVWISSTPATAPCKTPYSIPSGRDERSHTHHVQVTVHIMGDDTSNNNRRCGKRLSVPRVARQYGEPSILPLPLVRIVSPFALFPKPLFFMQ